MKRVKIKNSTVNISVSIQADAIRREVENFELASKTPIDCMEFIRQLKSKIRNEIL